RVGHRPAGHQARQPDATITARARRPSRPARLPGGPRVTLTRSRSAPTVSDELDAIWSSRTGIPGFPGAVSHKQIGMRFIWTGMAFLLVGGIEGLLLRVQLARAENTFLGPDTYNQVFTMHGTTMMFLFAVPVLERL